MARDCLRTSKSYQLINSLSPSLTFLVQTLMVYFLHKGERHFVHNKLLLIKGLGSKCASVKMQIVGISLSFFSILPLLTFVLPQHLFRWCVSQ